MAISLQADPTLAQGYIQINGTTAATVTSTGLTTASLQNNSITQAKLASNVTTTGPAFRAYANSATQALNAAATKITLGAEDFDTANCFSSSRFTPNVAGYYWISAGIRTENLANATSAIYKNGTAHSFGTVSQAGSYHTLVSDLVYLNGSTDYVELYGFQYSGTQNMATQGFTPTSAYTWMSGFLARAA